jgi:DNA-binding transcriptional MerR regulator
LDKSEAAFRTIGEVSTELGVPQHVLRYWETRFPQLRPVTRAGNRRYYRPSDVVLVRRIHELLSQEGYTVRGVQKLLATKQPVAEAETPALPVATATAPPSEAPAGPRLDLVELRVIRSILARSLDD